MAVVDWSQLPLELLMRIIENHLKNVKEFIMLSRVCHSWRDAAYGCDISKLRNTWSCQMPWLMLTDGSFGNNVYCHPRAYMPYSYNDGFYCDWFRDYDDDNGYVIMLDHDETINNVVGDTSHLKELIYRDSEQKQDSKNDWLTLSIKKTCNYGRRVLDLRWNRREV
ncbi:F-box protein SKP2A [Bienertia sinuspersici]